MKNILIALVIGLLVTTALNAQIITVKQDGTGDFITIQAAVDSATNGDTVLVYPGTYVENIEITNKNITLGSLTLITGDNSYINQTVIDGNHAGSCLKIKYISGKLIINGFTCCNGSGSDDGYIDGGAIFSIGSIINIENCIIRDNKVAGYGGGLYLFYSDIYLSGTTITNNQAYDRGGGLMLLNSTITFDPVNRCNIYTNYAAVGTDIYKLGNSYMELVVDTFTVLNPDYYYIYSADSNGSPQNDINIDILHHKIEQVTDNLYVDTTGSNNNSGLSTDQPLKTISYALLKMASDSVSPDTIKVANGIYSISYGEKFPLSLKRDVSICGNSRDSVILDAENEIYLLYGIYGAENYKLSNITLQNGNGDLNSPYGFGGFRFLENDNSSFKNSIIKKCIGIGAGGGSVLNSNQFTLEQLEFKENIGGKSLRFGHGNASIIFYDTVSVINCRFFDNIPDYAPDGGYGGGVNIIMGNFYPDNLITGILYNCLFVRNSSKLVGASALDAVYGAKGYLINCTFTENTSENQDAANIGVIMSSDIISYNSIFYNNEPAEFFMTTNEQMGDCSLSIYNSLVDGGEENIRLLSDGNMLYYDSTNINTDPLFYGGDEFPYNLSAESPCIDAGTLYLPDFINLPATDLAGNPRIFNGKIDMGAYEWNPTVDVKEIKNQESKISNLKVYPNPFGTETTISARWDKRANVTIEIYNNAGLLIKTLQSGNQLPGSCKIPWNSTDNNGNIVPAGVYFVVLSINADERESVKVVKKWGREEVKG